MRARAFGAVLALCLVVVLAFLALPILAIFVHSPVSRLITALGEPAAREALLLSLETTTIAIAVIVLVGTPAAWLLATRRLPGRDAMLTVIELPLVLPPAVAGIGLLAALGPEGILGGVALISAHPARAPDRRCGRRADLRLLAVLHPPGPRVVLRAGAQRARGVGRPRRARADHAHARRAADLAARPAGRPRAGVGEGPRRVRGDADVRRLLRGRDPDGAARDLRPVRDDLPSALALSAVLVATSAVLLGAIKLAGRGAPALPALR